jgi:hypothetical protein
LPEGAALVISLHERKVGVDFSLADLAEIADPLQLHEETEGGRNHPGRPEPADDGPAERPHRPRRGPPGHVDYRVAPELLISPVSVPLRIMSGGRELRFLNMVATLGTALDVTAAELVIEAFYPADPVTFQAIEESRK